MSNLVSKLSNETLESFKTQIRGEIIHPDCSNYDEVRKVYNGMIDKHPGLFVMCVDVADVIASVNFCRENDLLVSIRGGGHNAGGLGIADDALVIDLSNLKFVRVDTSDNTVRVGGGNLWGEVDHATHPFGLAIPAGIVSTTGVGGLTLGGGVGHLTRKFGLTIDNLLEADMVLADGNFVTVNAKQNAELFWAVRGGGGNFGVVTSFKFQAHPIKNVYAGPMLWPIERTEEIMAWYHDFIHNAPDELNGFIATMIIPGPPFPPELHNKKFCGIVWNYVGTAEKGAELIQPAVDLNPVFQHVGEMPYPMLQTLFDGLLPPGLQWYWRADYFSELPPEAIALHKKFGSQIPTPLSQMHLYPISGAAGRVDKNATPWASRDAKYAGVFVGIDPDPANVETITNWAKGYQEALHPYSSGGAYINFMMNEGQERVKASYEENYDRLTQIKKQYDPENLFRVNQNILPATNS